LALVPVYSAFAWVGDGLVCGIAHNLLGIHIPATIPRFLLLASIPYPLYLVHEKIGWPVLLQVEPRGASHHPAAHWQARACTRCARPSP